jgi:hypothetical protein
MVSRRNGEYAKWRVGEMGNRRNGCRRNECRRNGKSAKWQNFVGEIVVGKMGVGEMGMKRKNVCLRLTKIRGYMVNMDEVSTNPHST